MLTSAATHAAYAEATASAVERRLDAQSTRAAYLTFQESTSRILAHGASDRAELELLARLCDVPVHVLAFDVTDERS